MGADPRNSSQIPQNLDKENLPLIFHQSLRWQGLQYARRDEGINRVSHRGEIEFCQKWSGVWGKVSSPREEKISTNVGIWECSSAVECVCSVCVRFCVQSLVLRKNKYHYGKGMWLVRLGNKKFPMWTVSSQGLGKWYFLIPVYNSRGQVNKTTPGPILYFLRMPS